MIAGTAKPATRPEGRYRILLLMCLLGAAAGVYALTTPFSSAAGMEPDLVRLLRAMVLIKGLMAAGAGAFVFWRLGRPVSQAHAAGYLLGTVMLTCAVVWLWSLTSLLLAAVLFYASLIGIVAVAHADKAVFDTADLLRPGARSLPRP
jgi:hypothetical protein